LLVDSHSKGEAKDDSAKWTALICFERYLVLSLSMTIQTSGCITISANVSSQGLGNVPEQIINGGNVCTVESAVVKGFHDARPDWLIFWPGHVPFRTVTGPMHY
jgi:hypothetical protein